MKTPLENFEDAFREVFAGNQRTCRCGRVFYNPAGDWDWEDGELEALEADNTATPVEWSVGTIVFEGKEYALDCDCWHKRAGMIIAFLDVHARQIATYLSLEKKRLQAIADAAPVVEP